MRRLSLMTAVAACLVAGIAIAQNQRPASASTDDAAAALTPTQPGAPEADGRKPAPGTRPERGSAAQAEATRAFLGLGAAPDAVAAGRGAPVFQQSCAACHGPDGRGGIGPNLLYSNLVLDDNHGEKVAPFLAVGRPEKGMPAFASLSERERADIAEWLHQQVDNYANRGTYKNTNNVMTGDAKKGAAFFRANCTACHSLTGDMKGVGARFRPLDLQRSMIFPSREEHPSRAIRATVTAPTGTIEGRVTKLDDFTVVIEDKGGALHPFARGPGVTVALKDPLEWHKAFAFRIKDKEMTDLVTYLGSLK